MLALGDGAADDFCGDDGLAGAGRCDQTNLGNTGRQFLSALIDDVELIGAQLQPARVASVLRLLHLLFRERHHLARSKRRDHVSLIAPGMAVHENLVALFVDGENSACDRRLRGTAPSIRRRLCGHRGLPWILEPSATGLCEPDLHVFAKLFEDRLERGLEAQAFSGREIGGDDDVLDFFVGHLVDVDLTRQPAA